MSSKGLIELIILNQGLSVGIINETGKLTLDPVYLAREDAN